MKKLNLNSTVKVKLNPKGAEIYYHRLDNLVERGVDIRPAFPMVDQYGFTSFQLWIFMSLYGEHIDMCKPEVLDELYLYIDDEDLEDADCLMGYEVVEDDAPTMEEAINKCLEIKQKEASIEKPFDPFPIRTKNGLKIGNIELTTNGIEIDGRKIGMDKPLKDWTLGEIKRCCVESKQNCEKCPVSGEYKTTSDCKLAIFTAHWDLDDKPRFTEQEVEATKAIRILFPCATHLIQFQPNEPVSVKAGGAFVVNLNRTLFPSVQPCQSYTLDEIIGGADGIIQD